MAANGNSGVAVTKSHEPAGGKTGLEFKSTTDLPVGSPSPKDRKRKRKVESDVENNDGAAASGRGDGGRVSKREKRSKKKQREGELETGEGEENSKEPEKKGDRRKKEKKSKKNKERSSLSPKEGVDASSGKTDLPPAAAPPSPPDSNSAMTASPSNGTPSKSSLKKVNTEERQLLRKSVTFTPDTKATDGDSIKTLYQNHDPFAHYDSYQQHINNYPTNELPEGFDDKPEAKGSESKEKHKRFDSDEPTLASEPDKKRQKRQDRKERKEKNQKNRESREDEDEDGGSAKLTYLLTYHTSRDTWKFEKNKQNWILRHAFSPSKIPEEGYAAALKSYIAGLQSPAARDRLLAEANEIVKRGNDTISKDGEKLDPEDQKTNVARAKLVLSALGHEDEDESDSSSSSDGEE